MRLQKCEDTRGQRVTCLSCNKTLLLKGAIADLDGPAFRAYYHSECLDNDALDFIAKTTSDLLNG